MIKFVKTQSALTIFRKTGPEMITRDHASFDSYVKVCEDVTKTESDLDKLDGDFSYEDDDVGISYDRKTGRSEVYHNGRYHDVPADLVSVFKTAVRDNFLPARVIANIVKSALYAGLKLSDLNDFINQELRFADPKFPNRGKIYAEGISTVKKDENEIENYWIERNREVAQDLTDHLSQKFVEILVMPGNLEIKNRTVYASGYFVVEDISC